MTTHNILNPFVPCHAQIFLGEGNRVSTYCMRERGHADEQVKGFPGGHNIVNATPVVEVKRDQAA